jgi:hypothetical protein
MGSVQHLLICRFNIVTQQRRLPSLFAVPAAPAQTHWSLNQNLSNLPWRSLLAHSTQRELTSMHISRVFEL